MKPSVVVALMLLTVATAGTSRADEEECSETSPPAAPINVCGGDPVCFSPGPDAACIVADDPDRERQRFGIIGLKGMKLNDIFVHPTWCAGGTGCLPTSTAIACPVPADNGGSHGCGVFQHEAGCYSEAESQVIGGKLRFRPKSGFSVMPKIFTDEKHGWVDNDKQNVCLQAPRRMWDGADVATNQLMVVDLPESEADDENGTPACAHSPKECSINRRVVDQYFYDPGQGDDAHAPLSGGSKADIDDVIKPKIEVACSDTLRPSVFVGRVKNVGPACLRRAAEGSGDADKDLDQDEGPGEDCRLTPMTQGDEEVVGLRDVYYQLTVTDKQTLTLAPGTYTFCKVTIDKGAKLLVDADPGTEPYDTNLHVFDFGSRATSWVGADTEAAEAEPPDAAAVTCPGRLTIRAFDRATKAGKNISFGSASSEQASVTLARVYAPEREIHLPEGPTSYIKGRYVGAWVYGADRAPFQYCEDPS